jgi:hypothetical protein
MASNLKNPDDLDVADDHNDVSDFSLEQEPPQDLLVRINLLKVSISKIKAQRVQLNKLLAELRNSNVLYQ